MHIKTVILHDLPREQADTLFPSNDELLVLGPDAKAAHCMGCFGCWLKTPGKCVIQDEIQFLGAIMAQCEKVVIVSASCYGGYSVPVKRLLDRSIASSLPFFTYRGWRLHHVKRYRSRSSLTVVLYGDMTREEQALAKDYVTANKHNFGYTGASLHFAKDASAVKEVLTCAC